MQKDSLISVIVPVYNVAEYLPKCIESIRNQSVSALQIILVDDGSTDGSGELCDRYALEDRRIQVIHQTNGGPAAARRAGIETALGAYIGFVDGDDYVAPDMFHALYERLLQDDADFVHSGFVKNDSDSVYGVEASGVYDITDETVLERLKQMVFDVTSGHSISPSIWSKLFKRNLLIAAYQDVPDARSYGEDLLFLCECILRSQRISVMNQAYYHYTIREDSICRRRNVSTVTREFELYESLCELLKRHNIGGSLQETVERYFLRSVSGALNLLKGIPLQNYQYPVMDELLEKRIVLYGAGEVGRDYYSWISRYKNCEIIAWADRNASEIHLDYCNVTGTRDLLEIEFDILVIGVLFEETAARIRESLVSLGISDDIIRWRKPEFIL